MGFGGGAPQKDENFYLDAENNLWGDREMGDQIRKRRAEQGLAPSMSPTRATVPTNRAFNIFAGSRESEYAGSAINLGKTRASY